MARRSGKLKMAGITHLVIITHPKVEVFSAHSSEEEAKAVRNRLRGLMGTSRNFVHLVSVPEKEGIVEKTDIADDDVKDLETPEPVFESQSDQHPKFISSSNGGGDFAEPFS